MQHAAESQTQWGRSRDLSRVGASLTVSIVATALYIGLVDTAAVASGAIAVFVSTGLLSAVVFYSSLSNKPARPEVNTQIPGPRLSRSTLEKAIREKPRPFYVCLDCDIVLSPEEFGDSCPSCLSGIECLKVETEEDAAIARASLEG